MIQVTINPAAVHFGSLGRVSATAIGPSKVWMRRGRVPEPNKDTVQLLEAFQFLPHTFEPRGWLDKGELGNLLDNLMRVVKVRSTRSGLI